MEVHKDEAIKSFTSVIMKAQTLIRKRENKLLQKADEIRERVNKIPKEHLLLSPGVQWQFKRGRGDSDFEDFARKDSAAVEQAYQAWVSHGKPSEDKALRTKELPEEDGGTCNPGWRGEPTPSRAAQDTGSNGEGPGKRPPCALGDECHRKSVEHKKKYAHLGDSDYPFAPSRQPSSERHTLDFLLMTQKKKRFPISSYRIKTYKKNRFVSRGTVHLQSLLR